MSLVILEARMHAGLQRMARCHVLLLKVYSVVATSIWETVCVLASYRTWQTLQAAAGVTPEHVLSCDCSTPTNQKVCVYTAVRVPVGGRPEGEEACEAGRAGVHQCAVRLD